MDARIRDYQPSDAETVVAMSLRAWAPVFASMELVLGHEIFVSHRRRGTHSLFGWPICLCCGTWTIRW